MKLAKVDSEHRILIPELQPEAAFTWENNGKGKITLVEAPVNGKESGETFPPGSLAEYAEEWTVRLVPMGG